MPSLLEILMAKEAPRGAGSTTLDALLGATANPNMMAQGVRARAQASPVDPSWLRPDGSRKGMGFLGPQKFKDGRTSTELSIGVNFDGQEREIPSLVPTLSPAEIQHMLNGNAPTDAIVDKAVAHARQRMQQGRNVFRQDDE